MNNFEYKIIRSNRKTIGMEINAKGLVIRAPFYATDGQINEFISHIRIGLKRI